MDVSLLEVAMPEAPTDEELIRRTLDGDETAYAGIIARHQKRIYRIALAVLRDDVKADQVTQDVFVRAYFKLKHFQGRSQLETWLTRIAINAARDLLREPRFVSLEGARENRLRLVDPIDESPDAEKLVESEQLGRALQKAIEGLPRQQKLIFRLRHLEQMSLEAIGDALRLRPGTVRAHLFRAVHRIRAELTPFVSYLSPAAMAPTEKE